jgi:hypothetical protein
VAKTARGAVRRYKGRLWGVLGPRRIGWSRCGPRQYAYGVLFRDHPRVLLVSATVRAKTMELLGVGPTEYDFQEYPYLFPIRRSPVYFVETALVQWDSTPAEMAALQARIDEMDGCIGMDRNGSITRGELQAAGLDHGQEPCTTT